MFLIHRGHTVSCAARRHPHGGGILSSSCNPPRKATAEFNSVLSSASPLLPRSRSIVPSRKASPALADQRSQLFQRFCAEDPWKQLPVGHAARLAPSLLPGHLIHPLPTPPQAAPAWPKQNLMEHFSAQHPLTLGAFSLCVFFFFLPGFCGCDFNCVRMVPDKPCPCL